jgi:hypothetical protein
METEAGIAQQAAQRVAELRRAVAAGEYDPAPELMAGEIVAKLSLVRLARRRIQALDGATFEPEAVPPRRRFEPRPQPARRLAETRQGPPDFA